MKNVEIELNFAEEVVFDKDTEKKKRTIDKLSGVVSDLPKIGDDVTYWKNINYEKEVVIDVEETEEFLTCGENCECDEVAIGYEIYKITTEKTEDENNETNEYFVAIEYFSSKIAEDFKKYIEKIKRYPEFGRWDEDGYYNKNDDLIIDKTDYYGCDYNEEPQLIVELSKLSKNFRADALKFLEELKLSDFYRISLDNLKSKIKNC